MDKRKRKNDIHNENSKNEQGPSQSKHAKLNETAIQLPCEEKFLSFRKRIESSQEPNSPGDFHSISEILGDFHANQMNSQSSNMSNKNIKKILHHKFDEIEDSLTQLGKTQIDNKELHENTLEFICNESNNFNKEYFGRKTQKSQMSDMSFGTSLISRLLNNGCKTVENQNSLDLSVASEKSQPYDLGPFFGLPLKVKELIKKFRGIEELYDWQQECLSLPAIEKKKNLIYALPTSGGKTLVAEILILRELLCYKKNAIFILPYVAIVQEKVSSLSPFAIALNFLVEEYAGSRGPYPPRQRRRKKSVFIATIEKALGLINSLIETNRLDDVGLIVVDELHLLGESGRGATLEALLTKLIVLQAKIQVVGMSATIGNLNDLCRFLDADMYTQNFRPVELREYLKCGTKMYEIDPMHDQILVNRKRIEYNYSQSIKQLDPDQLGGLVMEVIPKESCLIFCASKKNCENVARLLSKIVLKSVKNYKMEEKRVLEKALKGETGTLCEILKFSIPFGIAYHHSGLTSEERKIIEEGFRTGVISVICCTSTLAAGVNLPAKRVILRSPFIGREFISLSRYKQMIGRAGRAGLGEKGESILICQPTEIDKVVDLLKSPMDKSLSSMHENNGKGFRHLLLSCVSLGIANTMSELHAVSAKTLWAVQTENKLVLKNYTNKMIEQLFRLHALEKDDYEVISPNAKENDENLDQTGIDTETVEKHYVILPHMKLVVSKLGRAAIRGCLELSRAHLLYDDLVKAQKCLVLLDILHLLYLVTPYEPSDNLKPDNMTYFSLYQEMPEKHKETANAIGISEAVAVKLMLNQPIKNVPEHVMNRFYMTLILYDLWNEMPIYDVACKYDVDRGLVQNLMLSSASFSCNVINFCKELEEFWPFVHLLQGLSLRLSHCCNRELLPLMELPAVKQSRAKQLCNAGYKTLHAVAKAKVDDLITNIEYMSRSTAMQLISAAKMLILEKVENLREDAEDLINGVDNQNKFI